MVLTALDTASSDQTVSLTFRGVNGNELSSHFPQVYHLTDTISYSNMDFALLSTLIPSLKAGISRVLVSYDIACQWHKNLQARLNDYAAFTPPQLSDLEYWRVAVPKFHISGHGNECQVLFNLAYTKWAGRMDGERIEGGWAQSTSMATWTRESGPNARRNILDDHWNADNWRKLLGLRKYYLFLNYDYASNGPLLRYVPREEPSTFTRLEKISVRDRNSDVRELSSRHC